MSMLEEKIRKNRDLFDHAEPEQGHYDRFGSKLDFLHHDTSQGRTRHLSGFMKVAAVFIGLFALSVVFYLVTPYGQSNELAANDLPQEIQEARMYYDKLAQEKIEKINECAASSSEASYIQKVVSEEIIMLDSSSVQLEEQLLSDKENKKLINALIRNYKTKSDLLDDILNRLCHI